MKIKILVVDKVDPSRSRYFDTPGGIDNWFLGKELKNYLIFFLEKDTGEQLTEDLVAGALEDLGEPGRGIEIGSLKRAIESMWWVITH